MKKKKNCKRSGFFWKLLLQGLMQQVIKTLLRFTQVFDRGNERSFAPGDFSLISRERNTRNPQNMARLI